MTFATSQSLSTATDQVNPNHSSPLKEKPSSRPFTTNGINSSSSPNPLVHDGMPSLSSDGIQNNCNSHIPIPTEDQTMPIAVVGIGCRFPGDASSPDRFWKLISEGRSAHGEIPKDRFNIDAFYHPAGERQGAVS
jgi:Beta-ketoacyl synthase, N-terminal domain